MKRTILSLILVAVIIITIATFILYEEKYERKLPILNPTDVNYVLVDSSLHNKGVNHTILDFQLINQNGENVSQEIIKDKVVVANFFFATCPTICPLMNNQLSRVHDKYLYNNGVIILSHTVWPEIDTVEALKDYGNRYEADSRRWQFLTGDKYHLYNLARKSYLVAPSEHDPNFDQGGEGDFIHTENIVLIDKRRRIRGFYDGTDSIEVSQLIEDVQILLEHK